MASIQFEAVIQLLESALGILVATVSNPAIGLKQIGRTQITIGVPPITRATGRTTGAHNALVESV